MSLLSCLFSRAQRRSSLLVKLLLKLGKGSVLGSVSSGWCSDRVQYCSSSKAFHWIFGLPLFDALYHGGFPTFICSFFRDCYEISFFFFLVRCIKTVFWMNVILRWFFSLLGVFSNVIAMKNRMVFSQVLSVVPSPFTFLIFQTSHVCKSNYFFGAEWGIVVFSTHRQ